MVKLEREILVIIKYISLTANFKGILDFFHENKESIM